MGIRGLQSYQVFKVTNGAKQVRILDEIRNWKRNNSEVPIIIIDISDLFLRATLENPEDILYGGRNNKLAEIIETFLQKICDAGAKLVFFQSYFKRQPTNSENEMTDTEPLQYRDRTEHFKLYADILRKIDNNESIDVARCNLRTLLGFDYESIAKKYGELHTSSLLRHIEIINYAKKHRNVLAILAKDSNFLMFDFHPTQYWLCGKRYLKLDELKVRNLDINKLNDHLGLSKLQKAVFGAILVTYYKNTRADVLSSLAKADRFFSEENFQKIFGKPEDKVSVRMILLTVHYVRTSENFSDQVLALQPPNTSKIVSDIFDDNANERLEEILKIRYNNYSEFRPIANETNDDEIVLYREFAKNDQFVFNVLCSKTIGFFSTSFTFIDFTQWNGDAKSYVNLILPIIKKNMGIVLQHRGDETITCKIALPNYHAQFFPNEYEAAIYPEITVPDLHQLIFTSDNEDDVVLTDIKWRLLLWTLSIDLDVSMIDDLQHKLKSVVLTLIFLRQENQITEKEADTILITEIDYLNGRIADNIKYPENQNGRSIRIAHLYVQIRLIINQSFRTCGLGKYVETSTFDGVHFHNLLEKYENTLLYKIALNKNEVRTHRLYNV